MAVITPKLMALLEQLKKSPDSDILYHLDDRDDPCNIENCKFKIVGDHKVQCYLREIPAEHIVVSCDEIRTWASEEKCDFIFLANKVRNDPERYNSCVAFIEFSLGKDPGKAKDQLQNTIDLFDKISLMRSSYKIEFFYIEETLRSSTTRYLRSEENSIKFANNSFSDDFPIWPLAGSADISTYL